MRDHYRTTREGEQCLLQCAQSLYIKVIGRLIEQQQVAAAQQQFCQMDAVALTSREVADPFLLVTTTEVKAGAVGTRVGLIVAHPQNFLTIGDHLPYRLIGIQCITTLVNMGELDRLPHLQLASIRLLIAHQHAEQGGLTCTIGADNADNAAGGEVEVEVLHQQAVAKPFTHS